MLRPSLCSLGTQIILPFVIGIAIAFCLVQWQLRTAERGSKGEQEEDSLAASISADVAGRGGATATLNSSPPSAIIEPLEEGEGERLPEEEGIEVPLAEDSAASASIAAATEPSREELERQAAARRLQAERAAKGSWTCRHRWTKWLAQNTLYIPAELSDLQSRYNRLHDKLLRELPVEQALKIPLTSPENRVRYLAWRPVGDDLAGRLLSLVSAYLLALLTDRVLLINFPYVRYLFCEPFTKSSWIFPEAHLADLNRFVKLRDALQTRSPIRIARLKLRGGGETDQRSAWEQPEDETDESIFLTCNGNVKSMLTHVQILLVESPVGFAELLASNPSHRARLEALFQGSSIYSTLMHHLLHPANDMWFRIIDTYHLHYTNDYDRPARLAVSLPPPTDELGGLRLKHQMRCALSQMPPIPFSQGRIIYYGPSSPSDNPKVWAYRMMKLPMGHRLITATDENAQPGYLDDWRRLLLDLWMGSWTQHLVFARPTSSALAMHYYRAKESLLLGEIEGDAEGECAFTPIPPSYLRPVSHDCTAFRKSWRSKFKRPPVQVEGGGAVASPFEPAAEHHEDDG